MKVGLGYSTLENSYKAGKQAAKDAVLESGNPVFTVLFATYHYDPEAIFNGVKEVVKDSKIIGASSECIIAYDSVISRGVGVLSLSGMELRVKTFVQEDTNIDNINMGEKAGKALLESGINKGTVVIFFTRGFLDVYEVLYGLYNTMGPGFQYIGGGVEKAPESYHSYTYTEQGINKASLAIALIDGIDISIALGHGFTTMRDPLIITKTYKNRVLEIDGIPAIDAYRERLGGNPNKDLFSYIVLHPLGFPNLSGGYLIRDPIRIDPDKSISFATKIHKASVGYIMEGETHNLVESSGFVAKKAVQGISEPKFGLVFDCISRYSLMGNKFELELKAIRKSIGLDIPIIGMLTWGEIGGKEIAPMFHNKTTIVVVAGKKQETVEDTNRIKKTVTTRTLNAELSILHEIASLSFSGSQERFASEVIEKTIRLLGVRRSALLKKTRNTYKLSASWGFNNIRDVLENLNREDPNQISFLLGEEGKFGILYLEQDRPIEDRERRIYNIFAYKLGDIFLTAESIREKERVTKELRNMALIDELTGLYNRRGFMTLAEQHLKLSERIDKESFLLFMDIDNLKWVNDNLGHNEGDRVLIESAKILKKTFRKSDILARIGGDEFVLLGLKSGENDKDILLSRLNKKIELRNKRRIHPYTLSLSIGTAVYDPRNPVSLKGLLEEADKQMYQEKKKKKLIQNN